MKTYVTSLLHRVALVFAQNENSKIKNSTGLTDAVLKNTLTTITSQQRIRFAKLIFFFPR